MSYNEKTGMYEGYIYKVSNKLNFYVYIGQTSRTIEIRWREHVYDALNFNDNYYFHSAIRCYGEDSFEIQQVEQIDGYSLVELKNKLNDLERHYIAEYSSYAPNGYNCSPGGEGGIAKEIDYYSLDKEFICTFDSLTTASNITGLAKGAICGNCRGDYLGTKAGFFRYHGEPLDKFPAIYRENGAKRINMFTIDGNLVKSYTSSTGIQREYDVSKRVALRWIHDHVLIDDQFVLFFEDERFDISLVTVPFVSKIDVFNLDGDYINTFDSQSDAGRCLNIDTSAVSKCCLGKLSHVKEYVFKKKRKCIIKYFNHVKEAIK